MTAEADLTITGILMVESPGLRARNKTMKTSSRLDWRSLFFLRQSRAKPQIIVITVVRM